jgi:hypothetical protein
MVVSTIPILLPFSFSLSLSLPLAHPPSLPTVDTSDEELH